MEALVDKVEMYVNGEPLVEQDICECGQISTRGVHVLYNESWHSSSYCDKCFNKKDLNDREDS
jgi:hypothetical protein